MQKLRGGEGAPSSGALLPPASREGTPRGPTGFRPDMRMHPTSGKLSPVSHGLTSQTEAHAADGEELGVEKRDSTGLSALALVAI